jgi:hypothetical protein
VMRLRSPSLDRRRTARLLGVGLLSVLAVAIWAGPALGAGEPPGLPGPPPGVGSGFQLPPAPGQAPSPEPTGPATTILSTASGPGLLSGTASLQGTRLALRIACAGRGSAAISVPAVGRGTLAQAPYKCSKRRGTVRLSLPATAASRIARSGDTLARVSFKQGGLTERRSLELGSQTSAAGTWTSVYGLRCGAPGSYQAQLLAPNFTDTPSTTLDVRPWLAWYTSATGWQWLGTAGPDRSSWYRWTATPSGVAEWQQAGTISPWTWGPISVARGHGTYVVSVFEAIYWYSHPADVWRDARSGPDANTISTYCEYP